MEMTKLGKPSRLDLLMLLLFCSGVRAAFSSPPSNDTAVMLQLRERLTFPANTPLGNWNESDDACQWKQVSCDSSGRVTAIRLANQNLSGSLPASLGNLAELLTLDVKFNNLSGPLPPDFSGLRSLREFTANDNRFTGPVPVSLASKTIHSLRVVNLANNLLQGPTPDLGENVKVDNASVTNNFCLQQPGAKCDPRVNVLLDIVKDVGYPTRLAKDWQGNDPCALNLSSEGITGTLPWTGITCEAGGGGNIMVLNLKRMGLSGTISSNISGLTHLRRLYMSNNSLSGKIPDSLKSLTRLTVFDVSYNQQLCGEIPEFSNTTTVMTDGNPNIGKDCHLL